MNRQVSDQTIRKLSELLDITYTRKQFYDKLVELEAYTYNLIDDELGSFTNKKALFVHVLREFNEASFTHSKNQVRILKQIIEDTLKKASNNSSGLSKTKEVKASLELDGYELENNIITQIAPSIIEPLKEEGSLFERLIRLHFDVSYASLVQMRDNYTRGNWEAANAMTRTAFEALISDIANSIATRKGQRALTTPEKAREYLRQEGFLDREEYELAKAFYSYASTKGSHPGLSEEIDTKNRRLMVIALMAFYIDKFENY